MWTTVSYRIESAWIRQCEGVSRKVWFLDAVQKNAEGRVSTSNICNGSQQYCQDTLNAILEYSINERQANQTGADLPCMP